MSIEDRIAWDDRWSKLGLSGVDTIPQAPPAFADVEELFPEDGYALELACGRGRGALWLASRGMSVLGIDVSDVAVGLARELTTRAGLSSVCEFRVHDLDNGLQLDTRFDLILCHLYRDPKLDQAIIERLAPGGLLAIASLSEVGAEPGEFRMPAGELARAFEALDILDAKEADGVARVIARKLNWSTR